MQLGFEKSIDINPTIAQTYLFNLNKFCVEYLQRDLYDFKITSLASLAVYFMNQNPTPLYAAFSDEILAFIKRAFFGGRCELICPGEFKNIASFDFPSMYGTILKDSFPATFS